MITALAAAVVSAGAVLTASAGAPAHAAPMSITVTPAVVAVQVGQHSYSEPIKVTDSGTKPLTVTSGVRLIVQGANGALIGPGPSWATLSGPSSFDLAPGQARTVTFAIHAPSGAPSSDVGALFVTSPSGAATATVGGAIVSRVVLRLGGSAAVPSYKNATTQAPSHSSSRVPGIAALAVILSLLAGLVLWIRRTVRRRRARTA